MFFIWNLYLYDGRSLEQFSKLDDIYYMKINSAAEVNLTSLDNVRYLEINNADITEKSNIGDMKKLISGFMTQLVSVKRVIRLQT